MRSRHKAAQYGAAIALGFGATAGVGLYAYEAQGRAAAGVTPTMDIGGISYALVPDRSIFAGDGSSVEETPVVGILAKIPGVPDTSPNRVTITTLEQVPVPIDIAVTTTTDTTAQNPVATNLELTGEEYAADKAAATQLITLLQQNEATTGSTTYTITSTGITSDLYGGRTGRDDTNPTDGGPAPQQQLAVKRAEVGEQALRDAATDLGYSLDSVAINTMAQEDLLTLQEQQRVTEIAASQGVSTEVLWQQYSSGALHPTILQELGNMSRPGVSYLAQGTRLERQIKQETVDAPGETTTFSFSGEGSIAIFGLPIAMLTAILQSLAAKKIGLGGWLLQSAARREIKQNMKRQTT